jgi:hypothetical protein
MKTAIKTMMIGVAACAFAAPASAYTLTGTAVPNDQATVINLQKPITPGYVRLRIKMPQVSSAGTGYVIDFCMGPTTAPCKLPVEIPGGQEIVVIYGSRTLATNKLTLRNPTSGAVPYVVEVDNVP